MNYDGPSKIYWGTKTKRQKDKGTKRQWTGLRRHPNVSNELLRSKKVGRGREKGKGEGGGGWHQDLLIY